MAKDPRLDTALVSRGLAPSRQRAQALIMAGKVLVDGQPAHKPGQRVKPESELSLRAPDHPYVSRGGVKLAGALDALDWDVGGLRLLDVGASTGGFTDCLLQRGAEAVIALDVGYGQLAWSLRQDPRVEVIERTNIRKVDPDRFDPPPDAAVVDVSFISLTKVLPKLIEILPAGARIVALIKPQFEVGKGEVGKGGVVRDPALRQRVVDATVEFCEGQGCRVEATIESPITGPKGNVEIFIAVTTPSPGPRLDRPLDPV